MFERKTCPFFPSADLQESNKKKSSEKWLLEVEKGLPVSRGRGHSGDLWFLFLFTACACFVTPPRQTFSREMLG